MVVTAESVAFLGGLKLLDFVSETDRDALYSSNKPSRAATATRGTTEMQISHYTPPRASIGQGKCLRALWHSPSRVSFKALGNIWKS